MVVCKNTLRECPVFWVIIHQVPNWCVTHAIIGIYLQMFLLLYATDHRNQPIGNFITSTQAELES